MHKSGDFAGRAMMLLRFWLGSTGRGSGVFPGFASLRLGSTVPGASGIIVGGGGAVGSAGTFGGGIGGAKRGAPPGGPRNPPPGGPYCANWVPVRSEALIDRKSVV